MSFWRRNKQAVSAADSGRVQKAKKTIKRSPPVAMEVKILALDALDSGLSAIEVGDEHRHRCSVQLGMSLQPL